MMLLINYTHIIAKQKDRSEGIERAREVRGRVSDSSFNFKLVQRCLINTAKTGSRRGPVTVCKNRRVIRIDKTTCTCDRRRRRCNDAMRAEKLWKKDKRRDGRSSNTLTVYLLIDCGIF